MDGIFEIAGHWIWTERTVERRVFSLAFGKREIKTKVAFIQTEPDSLGKGNLLIRVYDARWTPQLTKLAESFEKEFGAEATIVY